MKIIFNQEVKFSVPSFMKGQFIYLVKEGSIKAFHFKKWELENNNLYGVAKNIFGKEIKFDHTDINKKIFFTYKSAARALGQKESA